MNHRITKDCGTGWDDSYPTGLQAWGVSERQLPIARKVAIGDILLHFIDYVHAWAGYSVVTGAMEKNDRDTNADWASALPWVIPIEIGTWLTKAQAARTTHINQSLSHKFVHRQKTFTAMRNAIDASHIMAAIKNAGDIPAGEPSLEFSEKWNRGAENYYKQIVKDQANGKCRLCGESAASWSTRVGLSVEEGVADKLRDGFLDAAHILAHSSSGTMTPDNLRALCPNCHRMVDRLPDYERTWLFQEMSKAT